MKKIIFRVFTDGSCRPKNPGGGYCACILINKLTDTVICKTENLGYSTNNRAEMQGIISALEILLKKEVNDIILYTDSKLCFNIVNGIIKPKKRFNLKANLDLVWKLKKLISEFKNTSIKIIWVRRNSSNEMVYADFLASTTSTTWTEEQTIKEFQNNITNEMRKHGKRKFKV